MTALQQNVWLYWNIVFQLIRKCCSHLAGKQKIAFEMIVLLSQEYVVTFQIIPLFDGLFHKIRNGAAAHEFTRFEAVRNYIFLLHISFILQSMRKSTKGKKKETVALKKPLLVELRC